MTERALMEVDSCPLCGSASFSTSLEEPGYCVRRCEHCGVAYVTPRRDEVSLTEMYGDDSYWRSASPKTLGYSDYRADEALYLKTFRRRLDFALRDGPRSGRALDVGCAAGFCMAVLRERGFEVHGVEVSATIGSHAREHFGFDTVHIGTLQSSPHADGSLDLITMWDVIEHVVDPRGLLDKARALLAPGGLLVLETQDIDSRFARLLGPRWHHHKPDEHILHFNRDSFVRLLDETGFSTRRLTHRYGGKYVSFEFIAERAGRVHPALPAVLRPLTLWKSASVYLNFMDEMIAIARAAPTGTGG